MNGGFALVSGLLALLGYEYKKTKMLSQESKSRACYTLQKKNINIRMEYNLACEYYERIEKRYKELKELHQHFLLNCDDWSAPESRDKSMEYSNMIVDECGGSLQQNQMHKAIDLAQNDMIKLGYTPCLFKGVDVSLGKDNEPQIAWLENIIF